MVRGLRRVGGGRFLGVVCERLRCLGPPGSSSSVAHLSSSSSASSAFSLRVSTSGSISEREIAISSPGASHTGSGSRPWARVLRTTPAISRVPVPARLAARPVALSIPATVAPLSSSTPLRSMATATMWAPIRWKRLEVAQ